MITILGTAIAIVTGVIIMTVLGLYFLEKVGYFNG
jgi:energy-converting hydrogenase Eha subunit A